MSQAWAAGVRRFALGALREAPWRNGGGTTRTVLCRAPGALDAPGGPPLWRISVADIDRDGPFSCFPGMEREAVLIAGHGVRLHGEGGTLAAHAVGDTLRFPGERHVQAQLVQPAAPGQPFARFWNVMTDRARARSAVRVCATGCEDFAPPRDGALLVLAGAVDVWADGQLQATLQQNDGLVFDDATDGPHLALRLRGASSRWLATRLWRRV